MRRIAEAGNAHEKLARGPAETEAQIEECSRLMQAPLLPS